MNTMSNVWRAGISGPFLGGNWSHFSEKITLYELRKSSQSRKGPLCGYLVLGEHVLHLVVLHEVVDVLHLLRVFQQTVLLVASGNCRCFWRLVLHVSCQELPLTVVFTKQSLSGDGARYTFIIHSLHLLRNCKSLMEKVIL